MLKYFSDIIFNDTFKASTFIFLFQASVVCDPPWLDIYIEYNVNKIMMKDV